MDFIQGASTATIVGREEALLIPPDGLAPSTFRFAVVSHNPGHSNHPDQSQISFVDWLGHVSSQLVQTVYRKFRAEHSAASMAKVDLQVRLNAL